MKKLLWMVPVLVLAMAVTACTPKATIQGELESCKLTQSELIAMNNDLTKDLQQANFDLELCEKDIAATEAQLELAAKTMEGLEIPTSTIIIEQDVEAPAPKLPPRDIVVEQDIESSNQRGDLFPVQPIKAAGDYDGNTLILNTWLHNNITTITTPKNPTVLKVVLDKPVADAGRNLVLSVNPKGVYRYCGGRVLGGDLGPVAPGVKEFEFDLTDMNIQGSNCDGNRSEKFGNATEVSVGGYITEFNGNHIVDMYFK